MRGGVRAGEAREGRRVGRAWGDGVQRGTDGCRLRGVGAPCGRRRQRTDALARGQRKRGPARSARRTLKTFVGCACGLRRGGRALPTVGSGWQQNTGEAGDRGRPTKGRGRVQKAAGGHGYRGVEGKSRADGLVCLVQGRAREHTTGWQGGRRALVGPPAAIKAWGARGTRTRGGRGNGHRS